MDARSTHRGPSVYSRCSARRVRCDALRPLGKGQSARERVLPSGVALLLLACTAQTATPPEDGSSAEIGSPELTDQQFAGALTSSEQAAHADQTGAAWRVIEVPAAGNAPRLVQTPIGWLALSRRSLGDARAPSAHQSVLYRSRDGVHWESLPLDPGHDDLQLSGLAYGAGRYVMVGRRTGGRGVIWSSPDGEQWTEADQGLDSVNTWGDVVFASGRFFAFGFQFLGVSEDGSLFTSVPISTVQITDAAYGNGLYLLVGSGPMQVSQDGFSWLANDVDCALPGACISDPSGVIHQGSESHALFAEDRFFTDQLSAVDGVAWEPVPDRFPVAYVSGRFLGGLDLTTGLATWRTGGAIETLRVIRPSRQAVTEAQREITSLGVQDREAPLPESVSVEFDDGQTCDTATCINLDGRLLLIPSEGTPPLPDRVPRVDGGAPLLSDECPVSSQIFCQDYEQRTGCVCDPEAPRSPAGCADVSQYQCEGSFSQRESEWQVDEVAEAGCACDAVDPNQPPSFGVPCEEGGAECVAPLSCLAIESPPSVGPPSPVPFVCTESCATDEDCPSWEATGFCSGPVQLRCAAGSCQPRTCE